MWCLITRIREITVAEPDYELRDMKRICLEQARLCGLPESRAALEEMARN